MHPNTLYRMNRAIKTAYTSYTAFIAETACMPRGEFVELCTSGRGEPEANNHSRMIFGGCWDHIYLEGGE